MGNNKIYENVKAQIGYKKLNFMFPPKYIF